VDNPSGIIIKKLLSAVRKQFFFIFVSSLKLKQL
jgi:hypothetical protein